MTWACWLVVEWVGRAQVFQVCHEGTLTWLVLHCLIGCRVLWSWFVINRFGCGFFYKSHDWIGEPTFRSTICKLWFFTIWMSRIVKTRVYDLWFTICNCYFTFCKVILGGDFTKRLRFQNRSCFEKLFWPAWMILQESIKL